MNNGKLLTEPVIITKGSGGCHVEGPHMYRIGDYYYLMTAEGGTKAGHMVTIRRGTNIWGPFVECPFNPILTNRDRGNELLKNVGHGDLVEDAFGNWWLVALGVRDVNDRHHLGLETLLLPVTWSEDKWPIVANGYAQIEMTGPLPNFNGQIKKTIEQDHFDQDSLGLQWNKMREFIKDQYSLTARPGFLAIKASRASLDDLDGVSFIGRRQQDFICDAVVKLEFAPKNQYEEAGLTVFGDNDHHFDLFLTNVNGINKVVLRKKVADLQSETISDITMESTVYFKIQATKEEYEFFYSPDHINFYSIGKTYSKHISSEVIKSPFTGVYLGMYATSNGKHSDAIAYFDYFLYKSKE